MPKQPVQPVYAVVQATDSSGLPRALCGPFLCCFSLLLQVKRLPGSPAETPPWQPAQDPDWGPLCPKTAAMLAPADADAAAARAQCEHI